VDVSGCSLELFVGDEVFDGVLLVDEDDVVLGSLREKCAYQPPVSTGPP